MVCCSSVQLAHAGPEPTPIPSLLFSPFGNRRDDLCRRLGIVCAESLQSGRESQRQYMELQTRSEHLDGQTELKKLHKCASLKVFFLLCCTIAFGAFYELFDAFRYRGMTVVPSEPTCLERFCHRLFVEVVGSAQRNICSFFRDRLQDRYLPLSPQFQVKHSLEKGGLVPIPGSIKYWLVFARHRGCEVQAFALFYLLAESFLSWSLPNQIGTKRRFFFSRGFWLSKSDWEVKGPYGLV